MHTRIDWERKSEEPLIIAWKITRPYNTELSLTNVFAKISISRGTTASVKPFFFFF